MRVLAVRQPWASLIVEGLKTIEVRSKPTNIRERVAIYASTSKQETLEGEHGKDYNYRILPTGCIIGTIEIYYSSAIPVCDSGVFDFYANEHLAPIDYYKKGKTYFWGLQYPIKFSSPIPYKPPKGAVVWSNLDLPEVKQ